MITESIAAAAAPFTNSCINNESGARFFAINPVPMMVAANSAVPTNSDANFCGFIYSPIRVVLLLEG